ncbi:hypothetical protein [Pelagibacterium lacus]|uniref:Glycosyltransferase family 2 protein n=1 Tax=Pelagibacterium lacus TaxID=2282655 RepID=A0A369W099_9HYPH|nr:hypothetical protein [Pelagibacterium lacus]RDE08066.1 hypothetical protein DVH29_13330 [Pelagibacterium lacus]
MNGPVEPLLRIIGGEPMRLGDSSPLRRMPRAPGRPRPEAFGASFEDDILVYDAFWDAKGETILLVCPHPHNLRRLFRRARFTSEPDGRALRAKTFTTQSVMVVALHGADPGAREIAMDLDGQRRSMTIGDNLSAALAGASVLFTMNKDNRLEWIADWVDYHVHHHGIDTVIVFDNGSQRYRPADLLATISNRPGIRHALVLDWPFRYGAFDPAVRLNPYWAHFLQNAAMNVVLRRLAARARGILNLDVDELAESRRPGSILDALDATSHGLIVMKGRWIEAATDGADLATIRHRDFSVRPSDPDRQVCGAQKWAIDPRRAWFNHPRVQPHVHWIANRPLRAKATHEDWYYWHLKGINTNWKLDRARSQAIDPRTMEKDEVLEQRYRELGWV